MKPTNQGPHQGDGDKVSTRTYNRNVRRFIRESRVQPAASAARTFIETAPDQATRDALAGRRRPRAEAEVTVDNLIAQGRGLFERVAILMGGAVERLRAWYEKPR